MGRDRTERERRAAEEFADAVRDQATRFFDAVVEEIRHNPEGYHIRRKPLPEKESDEIALEAVHRVRTELGREIEDEAPGPSEVESWILEREKFRRERRWNLPRPR
jgi:hypothetical protein